jgi:formiminoglutamase
VAAQIPNTTLPQWPRDIPPGRFASLIRTDDPRGCRVGLIGLADDLGVKLNGGRPGAIQGPAAFRAALSRYGVADPAGWTWPTVFDAGDIIPAAGDTESSLHETHHRITEAVTAMLDLGLLPVGIGGGHDLTFPFVRAIAQRHPKPLAGLYFDAHLDVRPTVGSGMPFRRLVEDCGVERLFIRGMNLLANSAEHVNWFTTHGGRIIPGEAPPTPDRGQQSDGGATHGDPAGSLPLGDLFISVDLDVLDAAHAPGVSAINPCGWAPPPLEAWARLAGASPRIHCFDIMELSPPHDEGGRTARIAAHLFLSFLRGLAERPK